MLYLITINYNNSPFTIDLLKSLSHVKTSFRLILVDNASSIEDFDNLSTFFKQVEDSSKYTEDSNCFLNDSSKQFLLVRENENLGFSAGNNAGIRIAQKQADFEGVALLNNDTEVDPFFLDEILHYRDQNECADLMGCRIFYANQSDVLWYDGGIYYKHSCRAKHLHMNKTLAEIRSSNLPCPTGFITGCFIYISKNCIEKIGLLDETLFMYNEDLEYCIRAHKMGLKLYHVPTAVIWHKIAPISSPFSLYWGARNRFKVAKKHASSFDFAYTLVFYLLSRIPRFIIWLSKGRTDLIKAQIKGLGHGLRN